MTLNQKLVGIIIKNYETQLLTSLYRIKKQIPKDSMEIVKREMAGLKLDLENHVELFKKEN